MKTTGFVALYFVTLFSIASTYAVTIPTVPIGNPGNLADTRYDANGIGSVPHSFRMSKTEVTNAQYVEFLNAVGASDLHGLYNPNMSSSVLGGIIRTSSAGNYTYSVKPAAVGQGPGGTDYTYGGKPVVFVSWFDAIRFANWLHNRQGNGDTETGAYTLLGGTPIPSNADIITRNSDARWWLPSENEWYKAAYYDPDAGVYYDYPTGTNSVPNNSLPSADTGNSANFLLGALTDAGAYTLSGSPNGTFDQGGNVKEWTENIIGNFGNPSGTVRGGSWRININFMRASSRESHNLTDAYDWLGFRVASIPEPNTLLLLALGGLTLLFRRINPAARWG